MYHIRHNSHRPPGSNLLNKVDIFFSEYAIEILKNVTVLQRDLESKLWSTSREVPRDLEIPKFHYFIRKNPLWFSKLS